jgi:hypothetical protein
MGQNSVGRQPTIATMTPDAEHLRPIPFTLDTFCPRCTGNRTFVQAGMTPDGSKVIRKCEDCEHRIETDAYYPAGPRDADIQFEDDV